MKSVSNNQLINSITLVINKGDRSEIVGLKKKYRKLNTIINGGITRQQSAFMALKSIRKKRVKTKNYIVLIHNAPTPNLHFLLYTY